MYNSVFVCLLALLPAISAAAPAFASAYDEQTAKNLLLMSAAAYVNDPQQCINSQMPISLQNYRVQHLYAQSVLGVDSYGYMAVNNVTREILIAFRGTTDWEELVEEILSDIEPVPFWPNPTYLVQPYAYGAEGLVYAAVSQNLSSALARYPGYSVVFTGHSLGAAIVSIMAFHLAYDGILNPSVTNVTYYTYGQPRVGEYPYAKAWDGYFPQAIRVTHYEDIVVQLPPCPSVFGLCDDFPVSNGSVIWAYHTKTEVNYNEAMPLATGGQPGQWTMCTGIPYGEDADCADGNLPVSVDDHTHYFGLEVHQFCNVTAHNANQLPASVLRH